MDTNRPPPPSSLATPSPAVPPPPSIDSMQALQKAMQEVGSIEALLLPPVQVTPTTQGGGYVYVYVRDAARLCNREIDTATYRKLTIDECIQTVRAGFSVVAGVVARQAQLPELVQQAPKITPES